MATKINKPVNNNFSALSPIGLTLPIRNGNSGFFDQTFDSLTQVKSNIVNLMNTRQGERRMQPTFGTRLWNLIFDQDTDAFINLADTIVREDIAAWIPNVTVLNVAPNVFKSDQSTDNRDIYMLQISVTFMLNVTKQTDTVTMTVDNLTI